MIKILIVDDNKKFCEKVAEFFEKLGHKAFAVSNPLEVIQMVEKEAPHVVLLDIFMPEMSGLEVLKQIKEKYGNTVKTVVVTVADDEENKNKANDLGADAFVHKPFDNVYLREVVMKKIEEALGYRGKDSLPYEKIPNILIADDEVQTVEDINYFLNRVIECRVDTADNGDKAYALMKKNDYDLVFLDLKMPGLSGMEVMKEIKKDKPLPDVMVVTGYDSSDVARKVVAEGAIEYIPKPLYLENFKTKVKTILKKKGKYFEKG